MEIVIYIVERNIKILEYLGGIETLSPNDSLLCHGYDFRIPRRD